MAKMMEPTAISKDLINWDSELDDNVVGDEGETTTKEFDLSENPDLTGETKAFFRVEEAL